MRKEIITRYVCEICDAKYIREATALECEGQPVTKAKGVVAGDMIRITQGEGSGTEAVVLATGTCPMGNGSAEWKRYWHTVGLTIKNGHRVKSLLYDQYELIPVIAPKEVETAESD